MARRFRCALAVPTANDAEAATVRGIVIVAVTTLADVVVWLDDRAHVAPIAGIDETAPDIGEALPTTQAPDSSRQIRHIPHPDHSSTAIEMKAAPVHADRQARAYLLRVVSAPPAAVSTFVANVGPVVAAEQIRRRRARRRSSPLSTPTSPSASLTTISPAPSSWVRVSSSSRTTNGP